MRQSELKEKTSKGLFWSGLGSGIRQIISTIVGLVLLSRLSPDDYGLVGMLAIFISIAGTLQEGGFISALINRENFDPLDYDSIFWTNAAIGFVIYIVLLFSAPAIANFYDQPLIIPVARVLFLGVFFSSLGIAHAAYLKKYILQKEVAKIDIIASIVSSIIAILLAIKGYTYWSLVANTVIYCATTTAMRWYVCSWKPSFRFSIKPVKEMFSFSFKLILANLITQVYQNFYSLIIGRFCSQKDLGYYSQGNKWTKMISNIFTSMTYNIGQPVIRQSLNEKEREALVFRKILRCIVFFNTPCIVGLAFISKELITLLNPEFLPSVIITYIVAILYVVLPVSTLMRVLAISHGKSNWEFQIAIIAAVIQIVAVSVAAKFGIVYIAIGATACELLLVIISFAYIKQIINLKIKHIASDILPTTLITLFSIAVAFFIARSVETVIFKMFLKIVLTASVYMATMAALKADTLKEAIAFLKNRIMKH